MASSPRYLLFTGEELLVVRPDGYGDAVTPARSRRSTVFETKSAGSDWPEPKPVEPESRQDALDCLEVVEALPEPVPTQGVACNNRRTPNRRPCRSI